MKAMKTMMICFVLICGAAGLGAQAPEWEWAVRAGGASNDESRSIAIDNQSNQYVTGYFTGTATFGSYTLTASGDYDNYVAKLNPAGSWLWAIKAGGTSTSSGYGIDVDGAGYAYVTGSFTGTATFGSHTLTASGNKDIFTAKLDPTGNWLWAVKAGGTGDDSGAGIVLDGGGYACVTGAFRGTSTFGNHTLIASGDYDIFAAKLDPSGNWLWAVKAGGTAWDEGNGIALDGSGNAYLSGHFFGTATFGNYTLTGGGTEIFAAKLDPSGNWLWAVKAGGTSGDRGFNLAVDGAGYAYVTGSFTGTATFGSHTLTASGDFDIFTAKLDPNGNWLWAVKAGGTGYDVGYGIAVDGLGNAYVTGVFMYTAAFGSHNLTASGSAWYDIFSAKLDPDGNWLWAIKAGGTSYEYGHGIALDGAGHTYVTGSVRDTATFGSHNLTASGGYDIFVGMISPTLDAYFSADFISGLEPLMVHFTDQSTPGQYPIMNWLWTFGDGETSTQQNPTHTYSTPGVYTVSLTVMDQNYQTSTKVRPNYITVVERIYSVEFLSPESVSFGSVYLEEQSDWQEITFSNTGNVDLSFSEAHFLTEPLHFDLSEDFAGLVLPPGDSATLLVRFAPQAAGALSDTLFIVNNSTNLPVIKVALSGTGLYVLPKVPMNVAVTMDGDNAVITWDAVTQNIHDQPLIPDYYFIFNSSNPYGYFGYNGSASGLQYIHPMVGAFQPRMFYRVVAYKYYGRGSFDLAALGLEPGMTEAEVTRRLKLASE